MATATKQTKFLKDSAKTGKARIQDDLGLLKYILDTNPDLKKKVLKFMEQNYSKALKK